MRPHDFLDYWDTRIEANQQLFDNHPHMANFAFRECQKLWDRMEEKNKALLARHNALVEVVKWERECDEFLKSKTYSFFTAWEHLQAASAEVDRLIAEVEG